MFPRSNRVIRLSLIATSVISLCLCLYLLTLDLNPHHHDISLFHLAEIPRSSDLQLMRTMSELKSFSDPVRTSRIPSAVVAAEVTIAEPFHQRVRHVLEHAEELTRLSSFHGESTEGYIAKANIPKENIVNPHNFNYVHNPSDLCAKPLRFLIYIHSSPKNLKNRQIIRETWGHFRILSLYNASVVFILGRGFPGVQSLIDMEASTYGDILQEDFVDSYRNLTYKGIAGVKWVTTFCRHARYLLKTDDDILLDIVSLLEHFLLNVVPLQGRKRLIVCNVWRRMMVIREPRSKWYISREEFPADVFPAYCSGSAFFLSADLAPLLFVESLQTPFFWVDDYYITGLLVSKLGVRHVSINGGYLLDYNRVAGLLESDNRSELAVFHVKKLGMFHAMWLTLVKRHPGMAKYINDVREIRDVTGVPVNQHNQTTDIFDFDSINRKGNRSIGGRVADSDISHKSEDILKIFEGFHKFLQNKINSSISFNKSVQSDGTTLLTTVSQAVSIVGKTDQLVLKKPSVENVGSSNMKKSGVFKQRSKQSASYRKKTTEKSTVNISSNQNTEKSIVNTLSNQNTPNVNGKKPNLSKSRQGSKG